MFDSHYTAVRRYLVRRLGTPDVDDIAADTFLVAWRRYDDVPAEPRAWLIGVARNLAANAMRSGSRRHALVERIKAEALPENSSAQAPPEGPALAAFATLSDADRELVALISWDGLTTPEAAQVLGCSPVAVRVRLHRARRRLEQRMSELEHSNPVASPARPFDHDRPRPSDA